MISLDNLKMALSAIRTDISNIASRYLKKTDADSVYITKKSANNSFATKSSIPKISSFEEPGNLYSVKSLKFPSTNYNSTLGTIQYSGDTYDLGDLVFKGYLDVQYAFSADIIDNVTSIDTGSISSGYSSIDTLESGEFTSGVFAKTENDLVRAKRAALSSTGKEFNTPRTMQGVLYHEVRVNGKSFRLISTNTSYATASSAILYGTLCDSTGHLYLFASGSIDSDTTINIPFTITRLDGSKTHLPNPCSITINTYGVDGDLESSIDYDGSSDRSINIYSEVRQVRILGDEGSYYTELDFNTLDVYRGNGKCVIATYLGYSLPLVYSYRNDSSGEFKCFFAGLVDKTDYGATIAVFNGSATSYNEMVYGDIDTYTVPILTDNNTKLILKSSTSSSEKKFSITVDDSGAITATEI